MKITQELEAELIVVMNDYWDSYIRGDLETWASYLPDNYWNIGTNEEEVWTSKQEIVDFTKKVLSQLMGMVQIKDRHYSFMQVVPYIMVHEFGNLYIKSDKGWTFYSKMRLSSLLHKTDTGWKILHQHGSYPDSRLESGEFFGFENLLKENTTLRDAVKRRTIELELKNRELEIEAAVERVRAQSLGMYETNDLSRVNEELFNQLTKLNIEGFTGVAIYLVDESGMVSVWDLSNPGSMGDANGYAFKYDPKECITLGEFVPIWQAAEKDYFILEYPKEKLLQAAIELEPSYPVMAENFRTAVSSDALQYQWNPAGRLSHGILSLDLMTTPTEEVRSITLKMAGAFNLAYQRFLDLQKAEQQIREAQIQLALERVRAGSMSMHKSEDLAALSLELVKQVQELGVATWFCAFNIYDDDPQGSLEWGSNGQGTFPQYRTPREGIFLRYYEAGHRGESFLTNTIGESECPAHYEYLCSLPGVGEQLLKMKDAGIPFPASQIDHVAFFKYGYILFITFVPASDAHDIFKRFAKVFEQSYTRFLDLQKSEAQTVRAEQDLLEIKDARKKAEDTLKELLATQKQLIQSEKMASFGELTAGIAHEIQNPLNFVNNFSDLSNELMDEMKEEITKGEFELARSIAEDIKQNLEKISHHGKRADTIVKGMLQHSQSGKGIKEATEINALADEYLRLSYHGIRAKDKNFNASIKTIFDDSIGKVNIISQDMGRVLLNLFTNAFYAVNEKKIQERNAFEPTVTVTTWRQAPPLEGWGVKVTDNGNGIPQNIIDKIFQPFFTTKPPGQGTGLGLSLAYDIIKSHGGELSVETKENEGSAFSIMMPSK